LQGRTNQKLVGKKNTSNKSNIRIKPEMKKNQNPPEIMFKNFSKATFNLKETKLLENGLKTAIDYSNRIEEYIVDIENSIEADKGNQIIILDKEDYQNRMEELLKEKEIEEYIVDIENSIEGLVTEEKIIIRKKCEEILNINKRIQIKPKKHVEDSLKLLNLQ
ncbi:hypothetical protein L9F63_011554, partial [Diploptera punctata]